jgi:hypothetical protein
MLCHCFRFDRALLKNLCRIAHECLAGYMRATLGLSAGQPGM